MKTILFLSSVIAIVLVAIPVEVTLSAELRVIFDIAGNYFSFMAGVMAVAVQWERRGQE